MISNEMDIVANQRFETLHWQMESRFPRFGATGKFNELNCITNGEARKPKSEPARVWIYRDSSFVLRPPAGQPV